MDKPLLDQVMGYIFTGVGALGLGVVGQAWVNRKKTKQDVSQMGIESAIMMEKYIREQFFETEKKLKMAEDLLLDVKKDNIEQMEYIYTLRGIIINLGGTPPQMKQP